MVYKMSNIIPAYTPLKQADFTIINQDNRVIVDSANGINITGASKSSNHSVCSLVKTAPATPYSLTVHLTNYGAVNAAHQQYGICWRESSSEKLVGLVMQTNSSLSVSYCVVGKWNNSTSFNTEYYFTTNIDWNIQWFRLADNGTNRIFYISRDGINWTQFFSVGRTDFMTANQIGIMVNPFAVAVATSFDSFKIDYTG